jgi:hypothetical protein
MNVFACLSACGLRKIVSILQCYKSGVNEFGSDKYVASHNYHIDIAGVNLITGNILSIVI